MYSKPKYLGVLYMPIDPTDPKGSRPLPGWKFNLADVLPPTPEQEAQFYESYTAAQEARTQRIAEAKQAKLKESQPVEQMVETAPEIVEEVAQVIEAEVLPEPIAQERLEDEVVDEVAGPRDWKSKLSNGRSVDDLRKRMRKYEKQVRGPDKPPANIVEGGQDSYILGRGDEPELG